MKNSSGERRGIYVHIPLCDYKCPYCNYEAEKVHNFKYVNKYISCLVKEIDNLNIVGSIVTIYIGGGNPNSLSDVHLEKLLSAIAKKVNVNLLQEYTIEAKPNNLSMDRISILKKYGINRVSMPTQVVSADSRERVGLPYDDDCVHLAISALNNAGITNISSDLIFPIPMKMKSIREEIEKILSYNICNISCYPIEEFLDDSKGNPKDIYGEIIDNLNAREFKQYDLLNFAKKGYKNIHNSNYWRRKEYYALGAGAHGFINGERYSNHEDIVTYIKKIEEFGSAIKDISKLSNIDSLEEEFYLGLQLLAGIDLNKINERYSINLEKVYGSVIEEHILKEEVVLENNILKLTKRGIINSDDVLSNFLLDDIQ
ncbi:MAG: radical SAM family heme chaperone HemW [Gemella sp.]|nr:radical SAM family heme chaperone HemW [Gemella sp.]